MTRESRARWLAAATTALVVLLAAVFALLHNRPAPAPAPTAAPAVERPPSPAPPTVAAPAQKPVADPARTMVAPPATAPLPSRPAPPPAAPVAPRPMPPDDAAAVTPPAPEANDAAREVARPATAPIPTPVESVPAAPTSPKPSAAPAPDPARIATGQRAYARLGCAMCHSIEGRGNPGSPLDGVGARLDRTALYELTTGTGAAAAHLGAGLARRKQRAVGDPDMDALIDYLAQLK